MLLAGYGRLVTYISAVKILKSATETTAKALDAVIGLLALYEDVQEELYREIREVASNDGVYIGQSYVVLCGLGDLNSVGF